MWLGRVPPLRGDIAIYNRDGGEPDHIGIVESYLGDGKFSAIEGNTSVTNKSKAARSSARYAISRKSMALAVSRDRSADLRARRPAAPATGNRCRGRW
jgi:hypothetical protein